jgi:hypothetical protein
VARNHVVMFAMCNFSEVEISHKNIVGVFFDFRASTVESRSGAADLG